MNWILTGFVNWKTTITSILTALFIALEGFNVIQLTVEQRSTVIAALIIVFGWFAKDGDKTGKPSD